jgi:hypothetical protein
MLDDLRQSTEKGGDGSFENDRDIAITETRGEPKRFLGMTAVERMFIAVFLFLNVIVAGLALLLATGRLQF